MDLYSWRCGFKMPIHGKQPRDEEHSSLAFSEDVRPGNSQRKVLPMNHQYSRPTIGSLDSWALEQHRSSKVSFGHQPSINTKSVQAQTHKVSIVLSYLGCMSTVYTARLPSWRLTKFTPITSLQLDRQGTARSLPLKLNSWCHIIPHYVGSKCEHASPLLSPVISNLSCA